MTPTGVLVCGRDRNHKNAKYGNKLAANNVEAKSAEFSVSPLTDQAFAIEVTNDELPNRSLTTADGSALIISFEIGTDLKVLWIRHPVLKIWALCGEETNDDKIWSTISTVYVAHL